MKKTRGLSASLSCVQGVRMETIPPRDNLNTRRRRLMFRAWWQRFVKSGARLSGRRRQGPQLSRHRLHYQPSLDFLEDRITPSTFLVVNSLDNNLPGS